MWEYGEVYPTQFYNKIWIALNLYWDSLMPGPCSGKEFDINFGNRLYSKDKRPGSPLLF